MFNMNAKVVMYYGVDYDYRDHMNSGLDWAGRREWKETRRQAYRELKALGFKGTTLNAKDKAIADIYAKVWNAKYKSAPILGKLKVYEYSYL